MEAWKVMSYSLHSKNQTKSSNIMKQAVMEKSQHSGHGGSGQLWLEPWSSQVACLPLGPSCATPAERDHLQSKDSSLSSLLSPLVF